MTLKKELIYSFLIAVTCISLWWLQHHRNNQATSSIHLITELPDTIVDKPQVTSYDVNGNPKLIFSAERMIHYVKSDITYATHPNIQIRGRSEQPWHISSNQAEALHGSTQINFLGNVLISHHNDLLDPTVTMSTTRLNTWPNQQLIKTDQPVTITQPDGIIHAVGLEANLSTGVVKLLSNTREEYVLHS